MSYPPHQTVKRLVATTTDLTLLTRLGHHMQVATMSPFIRTVSYHGIAQRYREQFEAHLQYFRRAFQAVGYEELLAFHRGEWAPKEKPGIIISFDDGLRSHYDVARPLLEKYNFPGWFFISAGLIDTPVADQRMAAARHRVGIKAESEGPRVFMTWNEIREMSHAHTIGCHTDTHRRLTADVSPLVLESEIVQAKGRLERAIGQKADVFCWVGGEEESYSAAAANAIKRAGYTVSFMTNYAPIRPDTDLHQLQRSYIEAYFPLSLVRFQLSGGMDLFHMGKRSRVNRLTS